ncbi:hypothetical protein LHJ74_06240 [Streptomyces sp. N2-109]|uniref:Uncharacterized protein n=1 Tax=Streptomyces gossypii TaxID=2883101 RepID=A0ABT2JQ77_9ACTN|nr:hypothetical protein [Streptomyces gossypii]MCT2589525.1 hypothetical protein [Streptomyces gossypii]
MSPASSFGSPIYEELLHEWSLAGRSLPGEPGTPHGYGAERARTRGAYGPCGASGPPGAYGAYGPPGAYGPEAPRPYDRHAAPGDGPPGRGAAGHQCGEQAATPLPPPDEAGQAGQARQVRQISPVGPTVPVSPQEPAWERIGTL